MAEGWVGRGHRGRRRGEGTEGGRLWEAIVGGEARSEEEEDRYRRDLGDLVRLGLVAVEVVVEGVEGEASRLDGERGVGAGGGVER